MIIGLSGYARSGKDEVAKVLVEHHGFRRVAFADKLREVLYAINPITKYEGPYDEFHRGDWRVQDVIDRFGWDGYKETGFGYEIRGLLQRLGTEAGRQTLWDSIWVDATFADIERGEKIVVTDMRFPNEYNAVLQRDGEAWRIRRPGVDKVNDHPSETSLDLHYFDHYIDNDGTLDELADKVGKLL